MKRNDNIGKTGIEIYYDSLMDWGGRQGAPAAATQGFPTTVRDKT